MKWFLNAGLTSDTPPSEYLRVYYLNRLILVCMIINVSVFVIDMFLGVYVNGFANLGLLSIYLPLYYLHHKGKYVLVRNIFSFIMISFIMIMSVATFHQNRWTETENIFYAVFVGVFSLYQGKPRIILCVLVAVILAALKYYKTMYFNLPLDSDFTLTMVNTSITLVGGYFFLSQFQSELYRAVKKVTDLNDQLASTSQELMEKQERLKVLNESRNKLFSIVTHDLKNPLSQLTSLIELSDKNFLEAKQQREFNAEIKNNLLQVSAMMDKVIQWTKTQMEGFEVQRTNVNVQDITSNVMLFFQAEAEKKSLKFKLESVDDPIAYVDAEMLGVVLRNLISNAIKFTHQGGTITIGIESNNSSVDIKIKDEGVGISSENLILLNKGETPIKLQGTSGEKGAGVGLMLSHDLLERNGSTLKLESANGKGTTVTVSIPLSSTSHSEKTAAM